MTKKPHGTFFSVVRRKIGGINIIMGGEVDGSYSIDITQLVDG